jgi:hypothetical protein
VWKGLDLKPALSVVAEVQESWKNSPERRADTWPQGQHITWTFPGNDRIEGKTLALEWADGDYFPPDDIRKLYSTDFKDYPTESAMLIGSEGALLGASGNTPILLPEEKFKDYPRPKVTEDNHYHLFVNACLGGPKTESHFAQTGPMTESILLGTVAIRLPGTSLKWDHAGMKFEENSEANRLLRRTYRDGWHAGGF